MKDARNETRDKIRKALTAVYYEKEKGEAGEQWRSMAMGRIRTLGPLNRPGNSFEPFGRLLWRLAPAGFVLVLVLSIVWYNLDFVPGNEIAGWLSEDPAEFSLVGLFS